MPGSALWGWLGPLLVTAFGAFLRFNRLNVPDKVIFDETYYVPDALGISAVRRRAQLRERPELDARPGNTHIFTAGGEFVVHPPVGKLFIAFGEWTFGVNSFGWRFSAALIGSLAILLLARIARRMTRSTLLGCIAGLLLALDGLEFVMSRTALLDIFLMFWVLAAFGCLVVDRDVTRARLAAAVTGTAAGLSWMAWARAGWRRRAGRDHAVEGVAATDPCVAGRRRGLHRPGARLEVGRDLVRARPHRLVIAWDVGARRAAGCLTASPAPSGGTAGCQSRSAAAHRGLPRHLVRLVLHRRRIRPAVGRPERQPHPGHLRAALVRALPAANASVPPGPDHASPLPVAAVDLAGHEQAGRVLLAVPRGRPHGACASSKAQEVLAIGTPVIWWASIATLLVCVAWWLTRRDWRAGALLLAVAVGWLPWFWFALHDHRTEFFFYALEFEPFLILSITLCLGLILGPARASVTRRTVGAGVVGAYLLGVLLNFAYLYPILAGKIIPYTDWLSHMWYHGWI